MVTVYIFFLIHSGFKHFEEKKDNIIPDFILYMKRKISFIDVWIKLLLLKKHSYV